MVQTVQPSTTQPATVSWLSNFEQKCETAISNAVEDGELEIETVYGEVEPIVVEYSEAFLESLAEIAIGVVSKNLPLVLAGGESASQAVTDVVQQVEEQGGQIAETDAQAAVKAAANKLNLTITAPK